MPTTGVELESRRLTLRAPRATDAPVVANLVNEWEVVRYTTSIPFPYDLPMAKAFIASQGERWSAWASGTVPAEEVAFAIVRSDDHQLVGCIGLQPAESGPDGSTGGVEFGYWIGQPYWNQGYASEAVARLARFAFETLGVEAIWAAAVPINDASHRVLEKNGFAIVAAGQRESEARGNPLPVIVRKLTRAHWAASQSAVV